MGGCLRYPRADHVGAGDDRLIAPAACAPLAAGNAVTLSSFWRVMIPLSQDEVDQAAWAATTPEARLGLVLAAMHAARVKAIREIRLDDVDLGNRRIIVGGRPRPLDDLTREVLLEWLSHRSARWPSTANPYLLVNHRSANGTGPVSTGYFAASALRCPPPGSAGSPPQGMPAPATPQRSACSAPCSASRKESGRRPPAERHDHHSSSPDADGHDVRAP